MDYKLILSLCTIPLTVFLFVPYVRDILTGITKPHIYTWLIWSITVFIGLVAWYQWWAWKLVFLTFWLSLLFVLFVLGLSFKFGTKDITRFDTWVLWLAIVSIIFLLFIQNPLIAVLLASLADALWYIPTYRKSFYDPYSETLIFWLLTIVYNIFVIWALSEYNMVTLSYILTILCCNIILCIILLSRRRYLNKIKN